MNDTPKSPQSLWDVIKKTLKKEIKLSALRKIMFLFGKIYLALIECLYVVDKIIDFVEKIINFVEKIINFL